MGCCEFPVLKFENRINPSADIAFTANEKANKKEFFCVSEVSFAMFLWLFSRD
jgi:hypothetical protein